MPTIESTDKATRKMITQINKTLTPRFPLQTTGNAVDYDTMRFATLANLKNEPQLNVGLRVTSKDYALLPGQPVKTVSGMCLFGASGLSGIGSSGQGFSLTDPIALRNGLPEKIVRIEETPFLHSSETQTILQVTRALQLLAGEGVECFFHLPTVEYKLYQLEPFQQGKLTADQLDTLFAKIDRRSADLSKLVSKRIPVKTEIGSPLGPLENLLQTKKGRTSLDDCLDCASKDLLLAAQIRSEKPNSFLALCDLSYVAGYLKQAMAATSQGGGCLAVDMSQEKKIFDYTKEAAKNLGINLTMAVMLLAPATVTLNGLHGKDSLFMHQPDGLSPLTEQKIVFRAAKGGKQ
ncbi:MAG: hypothetical protein Q8P47_02905 [Candidatus Beckwithbacteria bacterium]|nr:hypothetical protein [Patescibacteria group bacterium]MDP4031213.1 hypothetical protein [Candidatus Beckwithbacteria bacterium]